MISLKRITGAIIVAIMFFGALHAQTYNDAAKLYNDGIALMKTDIPMAIETFEACVKMCDQVGDSAIDLSVKAGNVVADLYFQKAYKIYSVEKKVAEAIQAGKVAAEMSVKYNNEKAKEKTDKFLVQLYAMNGSNLFKNKEYESALAAFDSALFINPEYSAAIFNKALVYKASDNEEKFEAAIDLFIEKTSAANDTAQVNKAKRLALDFFRVAGNKENQANNLNTAVKYLTIAFKYGEDKDVYYALANVQNKQKKFDEALVNAAKGLALENGTNEEKAKFYYELAVANAGKGNIDEACEGFKNSSFGVFVEASKAQMTNLKCAK